MTEPAEQQLDSPALTPAPVVVTPEAGSRLQQLQAAYGPAKAAADESAARLKDITDGIKAELSALNAAGATSLVIPPGTGDAAGALPMRMTFTESWRVDSKKLKQVDPETYVRFAVKSGTWRLVAVKPADLETGADS